MNWHDLKDASLEVIIKWAEGEPWAKAMAACQQDSEWHAEGDVWTHTKMVCEQLANLADWKSLSEHDRLILIFTALFHDSAKPLTTQVDPLTNHVISPKHALKGEHLARGVLRDLGCELSLREEIARMVRFHGRPSFLFEKENPDLEIISLSWLVNNRLLYLFALADSRGRKTDSGRAEENLHFWKLVAQESQCYDQPYPFANALARFLFYRHAKPDLYYVPHEQYRCTVTLMSGLPGSGKDTYLAGLNIPVVSLDEIRSDMEVEPTENQGEVVQAAKEACRVHLRQKTSFAFNATNTLRLTRQRWVDLFAEYNARIETVYVEPPMDIILRRNRERSRFVPEKVILGLANKLEPPTWTESHHLSLVSD